MEVYKRLDWQSHPTSAVKIYMVAHATCTGLAKLSPSPFPVGYMDEQSYPTSLGIVYTLAYTMCTGLAELPRLTGVGRATQPPRVHAWETNSRALRQSGPAICLPVMRSNMLTKLGANHHIMKRMPTICIHGCSMLRVLDDDLSREI